MKLLRLLRPGLAARATLLVLLALAPVVTIGAILIYYRTADDLDQSFDRSVQLKLYGDVLQASIALRGVEPGNELVAVRNAIRQEGAYTEFALVSPHDTTKVSMCFTDQAVCVPATLTDHVQAAVADGTGIFDSTVDGRAIAASPVFAAGAGDPRYVLVEWFQRVDTPESNELPALHHRLTVLVLVVIAAAGGIALLGALILDLRLARVSRAANRMAQGAFDMRLSVSGRTGAASVARAVNAMGDRMTDTVRDLHESQTLQQRFVADVSHELRTPLAATLAAAEGLDSEDAAVRDRSIELVRGQTRRLVGLVGDLLEMSRFDAGQAGVETERIDVTEIVRDVVRTVAADAAIRITTLGDTTADVDVRRIHTILRNLVANALQHGEPPVDVVVDGHHPDELAVTVADDGAGVPSFLVPVIFERFARADAARGSEGEHSGLGLAIATENARLHGATLTLAPTGRTAFTLRLPRRAG